MRGALKRTSMAALTVSIALFCLAESALADVRIVEQVFALSADARSEFSLQFNVFSHGTIVIVTDWKTNDHNLAPASLRLVLLRPDGSEAARKDGASPLRLECRATEPEMERFRDVRQNRWTAKILNSVDAQRKEISGRLRITIPANPRNLVDTQFTLLGAGNAQEIPFTVSAPGRIVIETDWAADFNQTGEPHRLPITLSLVHTAEEKTYARRQGMSPLRAEHQVTELELDKGSRWHVRVQNDHSDSQAKVRGRLKVVFTPAL